MLAKLRIPMSVSARIALGFAIVLVLHLSIVVMGHYGLGRAEQDRLTQQRLREQVETLNLLDQAVGELQRHVLLYAFSGYGGIEFRVFELQDTLQGLLDSADTAHPDVPIRRDTLDAMHVGLRTHREIFEAVVSDRAARRTLVDQDLVEIPIRFEAALAELKQQGHAEAPLIAAESSFRAAQLKAMLFVHSPDSARVQGAKQDLADCRERIDDYFRGSPAGSLLKQRLLRGVDEYESAFLRMVQVTRGYLHLVNVVLAGEAEEFLRLADEIRESCSKQAGELSARMAAESLQFRRVNNVFSAITIVLGVFASWLIGRGVARPLNAITATLDSLARGVACRHIPGVGRRDELGKLAAAAQVFKEKAEQTEDLLVEVTHMKEMERQLAHSQKLESVGMLAAGIAHEINTPLQCVTNNIAFLKRRCSDMIALVDRCEQMLDAEAPTERQAEELRTLLAERSCVTAREDIPEAVGEAGDAVDRVVEIVHAMRCMSHPGEAELSAVDVNQNIENSVKISRNYWKEHAEVDLALTSDLPPAMAMSSELSQVVLNMIVNAADAIAEARADADPLGKIQISTAKEGDWIVLRVADTGAGIPADIQQRIFDPFFTTKEVGKGSGQGLALAYNVVVKRLGGRLSVESTPGAGATFTIAIPVPEDDPPMVADSELSGARG